MKTKIRGKSHEVYKVQRSLFESNGYTSYLIYNEDRDQLWETSEPEETQELAKLSNQVKFYVAGNLVNGKIHIQEVLKGEWF